VRSKLRIMETATAMPEEPSSLLPSVPPPAFEAAPNTPASADVLEGAGAATVAAGCMVLEDSSGRPLLFSSAVIPFVTVALPSSETKNDIAATLAF
jgi:hypothetical protein